MTVMTEEMKNVLILERHDQNPLPVAAAAEIAYLQSLQPEAKVQAPQDKETERGTAPYRDMRQLREGGPTLLLSPHLLTSDARWLTLLRTRGAGTMTLQRTLSRQSHPPLLARTTRWVAIHKCTTLSLLLES